MIPANDLEPIARDTTAWAEPPRRRVAHVSPGLALLLMALGAWAAVYTLYRLVGAVFAYLAGAA